jgi:hypothetical protein
MIRSFAKGINKKDLTRLLAHSDDQLQLLGWRYVLAVLVWTATALTESKMVHSSNTEQLLLASEFGRVLPDLPFILSSRGRWVGSFLQMRVLCLSFFILRRIANTLNKQQVAHPEGGNNDSAPSVFPEKENGLEEDLDFNIEGVEEPPALHVEVTTAVATTSSEPTANTTTYSVTMQLLCTVHSVIERYLSLVPSKLSQEKFDILRLLDDHISWDANTSLDKAAHKWLESTDPALTLSILRVLKRFSVSNARW